MENENKEEVMKEKEEDQQLNLGWDNRLWMMCWRLGGGKKLVFFRK